MNEENEGFRDPSVLAKWTRTFLYLSLVVAVVEAYSAANLAVLGSQYEGSPVALFAASTAWLVVYAIVLLATAILVLSWIYRANYNARQLGASDMEFTPGWAVGWYFVPIAWFWKPYQALKEVWRASANPSDWRNEGGSRLLVWWWALWLLPWGLLLVSWGATQGMGEAQAERVEGYFDLAAVALDIPLAFVFLVVIERIHRMQMGHWSRQRAEAEARTSVE